MGSRAVGCPVLIRKFCSLRLDYIQGCPQPRWLNRSGSQPKIARGRVKAPCRILSDGGTVKIKSVSLSQAGGPLAILS